MRRCINSSAVPGAQWEHSLARGASSAPCGQVHEQSPVASPREVVILFIFCVKPNSDYGFLINLPPSFSLQVPKVTQAHQALLAHLDLQALLVPQGPLEAEDPKARSSQTCSTASAQVTNLAPGNLPLPLMVPTRASCRLCDRVF